MSTGMSEKVFLASGALLIVVSFDFFVFFNFEGLVAPLNGVCSDKK